MDKEALDRIRKAYSCGLKVQIWFNGYWEDFDVRDYSMYSDPFSENRQYRIIGSDYADIAEKQIAELKEQNTNLQEMLKTERSVTCKEEYLKKVTELEQENAELRAKVTALENANRAMVKELDDMASNGLNIRENVVTNKEQLTKAKELLEKLLLVSCNSEVLIQYPNCSKVLQARVEAEQFLFERGDVKY